MELFFSLRCLMDDESTDTLKVTLPDDVRIVLDIKKFIEDALSIPVYGQTIRYNSAILQDESETISHLRICSGDTLDLTYYSVANCVQLRQVIDWLKSVVASLKEVGVPTRETFSSSKYGFLEEDDHLLKELGANFSMWGSPVCNADKQFFIDNGGLNNLIEFYSLLLSHPWLEMPLQLKKLENDVVYAFSTFGESLQTRQELVRLGLLPMCIQSLLRVKIDRDNDLFVDPSPCPPEEANSHTRYLQEVITSSVAFLSGLSEVEQCRMQIASNATVLSQLFSMIHYNKEVAELMLSVIVPLAYTPETHRYITEVHLLQSLVSFSVLVSVFTTDMVKHIQFLTAVFFSQIVLVSPRLLLNHVIGMVHKCLKDFLKSNDPAKLTEYERAEDWIWSTFLPYVKLAYLPSAFTFDHPMLSDLPDMAMEITMITLQVMLGMESHRAILLKEGILDFVTCIPWYTSGPAQERARAVVLMIQQAPDVELQPPSLQNMAKACVAKHYCGLPAVVQMTVSGLVHHILQQ